MPKIDSSLAAQYNTGAMGAPIADTFDALREHFGFVPGVYRAQALLPRLVEAEVGMEIALVAADQALTAAHKQAILHEAAAAQHCLYGVARHSQMLQLLGKPASAVRETSPLMDFAVKLATCGPFVNRQDITYLGSRGFGEEAILETILVSAWSRFLATISTGLSVAPDFETPEVPLRTAVVSDLQDPADPFLEPGPIEPTSLSSLQEIFGFPPMIFQLQSRRPEWIAPEVALTSAILLPEDQLTRELKERIMMVVSAANANTYGVTLHSQMLTLLGVSPEHAEQIAIDHRQAELPETESALLDFTSKLAAGCGPDLGVLKQAGFREEQILEAVAITALANFLSIVAFGLGALPDFKPRRVLRPVPPKIANLSAGAPRPTTAELPIDPDAALVAKIQTGDIDCFEELMLRHSRRVYRTLVGMLGDPDEARDAMQDTFLKAFEHLPRFEGRSKFSTWLVSIATNTGLQRLRDRRPTESLDEDDTKDDFRPRQIRAWSDDPEEFYSRTEVCSLVEKAVMGLPAKYRVVVMLRDLEQLSTEETAASLGLAIPTMKSRLLRGRLMLRQALEPHFARSGKGVAF
jgi:RNA polymerase sigma-70 factor (ECF subfamily)